MIESFIKWFMTDIEDLLPELIAPAILVGFFILAWVMNLIDSMPIYVKRMKRSIERFIKWLRY